MTGRGLRGRRWARLLLITAFLLVLGEVSMFLAAPNDMGPMFAEHGNSWVPFLLIPAAAAQGLGLAWMSWLYPRNPEAHASTWRFHRA